MDTLFNTPWWMIWLAATIVLAITEVFTSMAVALCLAVGTLAAMIAALCGGTIETQVITLAIAAVVAFIGVAPLMARFMPVRRTATAEASNMDALLGRQVTVPADGSTRVKVDGDSWQARSADGSPLTPGAPARIVGYDSIVLLLEQIN